MEDDGPQGGGGAQRASKTRVKKNKKYNYVSRKRRRRRRKNRTTTRHAIFHVYKKSDRVWNPSHTANVRPAKRLRWNPVQRESRCIRVKFVKFRNASPFWYTNFSILFQFRIKKKILKNQKSYFTVVVIVRIGVHIREYHHVATHVAHDSRSAGCRFRRNTQTVLAPLLPGEPRVSISIFFGIFCFPW